MADTFLRADFIAYGEFAPGTHGLLESDILAAVAARRGVLGGGLVETDADGVPLAIRGVWRHVWRLADRLMLLAVRMGVQR